MLSHVQIKVKKTSVIKEYLNFLRAFAGNVCSEFEGKKYHQISRFEIATISKKLRNYANDDWLIEEAGVVFTKDVAETAYAIAKEIFELTENIHEENLQNFDEEYWI